MKTMRPLILLLSLLALPAVLSAKGFEGKIRLQMTTEGNKTMFLNYFFKESLMRTDMEVGKGQFTSLVDTVKREITILMPDQKMYMVRPMPEPAKRDASEAPSGGTEIIRTGETEKILGYKCEKIIIKSKEGTSDVWGAEGIGSFLGVNSNPMGKPAPRNAWETALADRGFFPLRMVHRDISGKERMRMEAVAVEPQSLPASTFAIPEGFQKFEMPTMPGLGDLNPFGRKHK
jgi:hypothetical protein